MYIEHSSEIWWNFPELVAGAVFAEGVSNEPSVDRQVTRFNAIAEARLESTAEGQLPEIQAWRRTFSKMGLKPTQYRCASEALLRRFRKEGSLPQIHPLIDLCNAISLAFAIPVAVLDTSELADHVVVRPAVGNEEYVAFSGDAENPEPGEVIFADAAGRAHARRWTNRQSRQSAVRETTASVLIVAEAMHSTAPSDIQKLIATVADEISMTWSVTPKSAMLTETSPRFAF
jgi:DNA/RNA-binding domain of Phe-tRNA-synthetase-like protein